MTRHEAREQAFLILFEQIFDSTESVAEILEKAEDSGLITVNAFARRLAETAEEHSEEIDSVITENAIGWSLQRLPKVSLALLRLAVAEMKYCDDIPTGVSINEAVELAKTYGTTDDASYINGVLGTVAKAL